VNKIKYRFFVDKECNWFQDGKAITHKGIYNFNYKHLKINKDKVFFVQEEKSIAYVDFEDKPFLVRIADVSEKKTVLLLNDSTKEELDVSSLYFKNNIPYCSVKQGVFEARFSRPALYQISKIIKITDGKYYIGSCLINHQ
jgi:hypothetical protein